MKRVLVLVALVVLCGVALARPGGGDSFSGGGGHGDGGGGSDAGVVFELIYWSLRLAFYYPQVGLPLLAIILGWVIYSAYKNHANKDWDSGPPVSLRRATDLAELRKHDPDFSQVVFEDFAFRLFSTAQRARHSAEALATIAPYVSPAARAVLGQREPRGVAVEQVIVGAIRVYRADIPTAATDHLDRPTRVRIGLEFEANVATRTATFFSVESWLFGRETMRRSKPPGAVTTFPCPNCGAPWQASATGTQACASCNEVVDNGRFDWVVEQLSVASIDERPPTLTTNVPERGTDLPTYRQRDVDDRFAQLHTDDPDLTRSGFEGRVRLVYRELNEAWSKNDLGAIRGYVSDGLFDYLSYWIDAYKRQGLRNRLTNMRITKTELAKLVRDRWYVAMTIRIWATGNDVVIHEATGKIVRGHKSRERPYSEYWTFIRSTARKGAPVTERRCSHCGAPLEVTMAGACTHCNAHITAGEFDWVLSKVEQDDSYRG
jgi:uncharacterized Zn finger protein (UPF0148 family)